MMLRVLRKQRAQGTLEYILVLVAVVLAVLAVSGKIGKTVESEIMDRSDSVLKQAGNAFNTATFGGGQ